MTDYPPSYKLCIQTKRAEGLLRPDSETNLNSYVKYQILGSKENQKTKTVLNETDPVFNSIITLNGFFVGSDVLNVSVYHRVGAEEDAEKDIIVGCESLHICDMTLGSNENVEIELYKYSSKAKGIDKKSEKGSAGKIITIIHVAQMDDTPFELKEWSYPLYNAWLDVIAVTNCPTNQGAQFYISSYIKPTLNTQKKKTDQVDNASTTIWNNRRRILLDTFQSQIIYIELHRVLPKSEKEQDKKHHRKHHRDDNDKVIASLQMPLNRCSVGHVYKQKIEMEVPSELFNGIYPALVYRLQITAKGTDPFEFLHLSEKEIEKMRVSSGNDMFSTGPLHCSFQWDATSSTYSTDFSGYSQGYSLSGIHSSEKDDDFHIHSELSPNDKPYEAYKVTVSIVSIENVPINSTNAYCTLQEYKRLRPKGEPEKFNLLSEGESKVVEYNKTKKGNYIEFLVHSDSGIIAGRKFKVKNIDSRDEKQSFNLLTDQQLKQEQTENEDGNAGKVTVIFSKEVSYY